MGEYTVSQFRRDVREGPYVFPGGGEVYYLCSDGGLLCHGCANKERRNIVAAIAADDSSGWRVVGVGNTYNEDPQERTCDHCGAEIGDQGEPDEE